MGSFILGFIVGVLAIAVFAWLMWDAGREGKPKIRVEE